ncbi:hypothetical protein ACFV4P_22675 [Kitasatospora sp. NPDC059795]|uniref:NucA/NucB deoxyribonuclease domain-containing protein n=1 Tax=Kitasatospora sp. NPDC059795 TaxID=3346949 RepID=UPI003653B9CA
MTAPRIGRLACAPLPHADTEECDEFPFASTWEGAGRGDQNYSVLYVGGTQNGQAGTALGSWYGSDRILHNDAFGVRITPSQTSSTYSADAGVADFIPTSAQT